MAANVIEIGHIKREVKDGLAEVVGINAQDAGLKGDGVTDDSAKLRIAINAENLLESIPLGVDTTADGISDGWELSTGAGQTVVPTIDSGYQKLEITAGSTANSSYISNTPANFIPCATGDTITACVTGKKTGNVNFGIVIDWYNSSKAYVSQTGQSSSSATTDAFISISGIVPAGVAYYRVRGCRINPNSSGALGAIWTKNVFTIRESVNQLGINLHFQDGVYNISSDVIIPKHVNIIMSRNAVLNRTANTNLVLNCSIEAGLYQILNDDGTGTLSGTPKVSKVYPEWFGAKGDGITDDYTAITKALALAPRKVLLTNADYLTGTKIIVPSYKSLVGISYTKITASANIDIIEVLTGGLLYDLHIRATNATYTGACVLLDGKNRVQFAEIEKIKIRNEGTNRLNGTALLLKALDLPSGATDATVFRNKFTNIDIDYFEYGIKLDVPDALSGGLTSAWINSNDFVNIYMLGSKWFLYLKGKDSSTRAVDGNNFVNVHLQYDEAGTTLGSYCQGRYNIFDNIHFWDMGSDRGDVSASDNAIQFTTDAVGNVVRCPQWYEKYLSPNKRFGNYVNDTQKHCNTFEIFDDFIYQTLTPANTPWLLYKGTDAQALLPAISLDYRGKLVLTTGNNSGILAEDGSQISCAIITPPGQGGFVMEARLRVVGSISGVSINVGLSDKNNALNEPFSISGSTITSNDEDAACFVYDDAATIKQWFACAVKTNTDDTGNSATGVAPSVANTWQILRIVVSDACNVVWFYIDGVLVKTLRTSGVTTGNLYGTIVVNSTEAASKSVEVDYIHIKHSR